MNWDDVRIFLAVARSGQILQAGKRLNLNHATVGRRVSALEDSLKTKLLDRRTNGCTLTSEGERFLHSAERMEAEMMAARSAVGHTDAEIAGTVRIGAPDGFGVAFLAPRLGALMERYPDLTIQLVPVPRTFSVSRREADIVITVERPDHGRLIARKLVDYTLALYASKAYLARHGAPEKPEDLSRHHMISYVEDLIYSPSLNYAEEFGKGWAATFECSSALGQTEAVRAGMGIGVLHAFIARQDENLDRVLPQTDVQRAYWIVYHESTRNLRRITAVSDFIHDLVERDKRIFL